MVDQRDIAPGTTATDWSKKVRIVNKADDPVNIAGVTEGTFAPQGFTQADFIPLEIDDTEWTEVPLGSIVEVPSNVYIQNQSDNGNIYLWRYDDPGVGSFEGIRVTDGDFRSALITPGASLKIYVRILVGTGKIGIEILGNPA